MAQVAAGDGVLLCAEAHGAGEPLILSPGFCQTRENFRPQVEPLTAAGFRVILWDYRGHGQSDAPADPAAYSMERVTGDLRCVLDWAAPGQRAVVGGLSFGGLASQHFALAHPERVSALLLIASGPGFKRAEAQAAWQGQVERTAAYLERRGFAGYAAGPAGPAAIGLRPELPAAQAAARAIEAQNPQGVAHFGRRVAGPAPATLDRLAELTMPALVLVGALDRDYTRAAEVMAARLPNARHVVIETAGHCVNLERAAEFNRAVLDFLHSRPAPA